MVCSCDQNAPGNLARQVLLAAFTEKRPRCRPSQEQVAWNSDLAWCRFRMEPAKLSEVAENLAEYQTLRRIIWLLFCRLVLVLDNIFWCSAITTNNTRFEFFTYFTSSLRNWANHDRYRLRPSTPAQLCWSSSRLQPLQNNNLIKFAIIRPSTLNHDNNFLICMKLFNVCANKLSLSLSLLRFGFVPRVSLLPKEASTQCEIDVN